MESKEAEEEGVQSLLADGLLSSPAMLHLDTLVEAGSLAHSKAKELKAKFAQLYRYAQAYLEKEKDALEEARRVRDAVRDEHVALEKARQQRDDLEAVLEAADQQKKQLLAERMKLDEKDAQIRSDLVEATMMEQELQDDLRDLARENEATVQPALQALRDEIVEAKTETARAASLATSLVNQKAELLASTKEVREATEAAKTESIGLRNELTRVKGEPGRVNKQLETVRRAVSDAEEEVTRIRASIKAREADTEAQSAASRDVARVAKGLADKLAKYAVDIEAREREVVAAERTLRSEKTQTKDLMERRVELQLEDAEEKTAAKAAERGRDLATAAYEKAKGELKTRLDALNSVKAQVPALEAAITDVQVQIEARKRQGVEASRSAVQLQREIEDVRRSILDEESLDKRVRAKLAEEIAATKALEEQKEGLHREEALGHKRIGTLKLQRENRSRELGKIQNLRREVLELGYLKEVQLLDLAAQLTESKEKLKHFGALYEVVKSERNTFANSIQSTTQSLAEMRERIKILSNEVDILKNEVASKDKALNKEKHAHALALAQREMLRSEANKCAALYRSRQAAVETQVLAIDKLNSIIARLEKDMMMLKKQYEAAVQARNYTGIQLIDRNDELCILYEKSNIHEKTLSTGERTMQVILEEIRALSLAVADQERRLTLLRNKFPETPKHAERILELQRTLLQTRQIVERLCKQLEDPANMTDRWMPLGGVDPDVQTLQARARLLEDRIAAARDEILEKEMTIEELAGMIARVQDALVRAQTPAPDAVATMPGAAPDAPGVAMSRLANELQGKLRDVTRRMMSCVAELSMYQATAIKLSADAETAEAEVMEASARLAAGRAPTSNAELKWQALERQQATLAASKSGADEPGARPAHAPPPRPNAYVPEGIGIPRPYGEFAPLKPAETGANMRHIRNPVVKELEL